MRVVIVIYEESLLRRAAITFITIPVFSRASRAVARALFRGVIADGRARVGVRDRPRDRLRDRLRDGLRDLLRDRL